MHDIRGLRGLKLTEDDHVVRRSPMGEKLRLLWIMGSMPRGGCSRTEANDTLAALLYQSSTHFWPTIRMQSKGGGVELSLKAVIRSATPPILHTSHSVTLPSYSF